MGKNNTNQDEFRFSTPFFSFGFKKSDNEIRLEEGETIILRYWSWRKFGFVRKSLKLVDGVVVVNRLD
jgi:hypothetical protein